MYRSLLGGLVRALRDVLGYLGASLWRFLVRLLVGTWVFLCVLGCVFLQHYFGMYLLRGISTLPARALPRTPVCACVRLCARVPAPMCAPVRSLGLPWRFYIAVASPRRALCARWRYLSALGSL